MNISDARIVARQWVIDHAKSLPGFTGAFVAGSVIELPDEAILPTTSDIDVMVVLDVPDVPAKPGKFLHHGVLLEVTYLPLDLIRDPKQVLGHYHLAVSFRRPVILVDPAGHLAYLGAVVGEAFAKRTWVERRCEQAGEMVLKRIDDTMEGRPFEEQVMSWLFAAGGLPHVLLVAGLRNPTVRRRYEASRVLLHAYGHDEFYPGLIALLDPQVMSSARVAHHVAALEDAFDAAGSVCSTPFFFAADISAAARSVAIDGSREMIAHGQHREALFWIVATFARCQMVLHADAPACMRGRWDRAFHHLLADLGVRSFADLQRRCEETRDALPQVHAVAGEIMEANEDVEEGSLSEAG